MRLFQNCEIMAGRKKDAVWVYFDELPKDTGVKTLKAKCKSCKKVIVGLVARMKKQKANCGIDDLSDKDDDECVVVSTESIARNCNAAAETGESTSSTPAAMVDGNQSAMSSTCVFREATSSAMPINRLLIIPCYRINRQRLKNHRHQIYRNMLQEQQR